MIRITLRPAVQNRIDREALGCFKSFARCGMKFAKVGQAFTMSYLPFKGHECSDVVDPMTTIETIHS